MTSLFGSNKNGKLAVDDDVSLIFFPLLTEKLDLCAACFVEYFPIKEEKAEECVK